MNSKHVDEQANCSAIFASEENSNFSFDFKQFELVGDESFAYILEECQASLVFTREYEHAAGVISVVNQKLEISYFSLPHPSGVLIDQNYMYILSTRTPHLLYRFKPINYTDDRCYFTPDIIKVLPGSLYGHEIIKKDRNILINATGFNEVVMIKDDFADGIMGYYRPSFVNERTPNCMQLNSICFDKNGIGYSTCFSTIYSDFRPWKDEDGPNQRGGIIRHGDDKIIVAELTCPHSARIVDDQIIYCNSGYGEVRQAHIDGSNERVVCKLPGFTRGLAVTENYLFVGLSKVISGKDKYAPGLDTKLSKCGISIVCRQTGKQLSALYWPNGLQIFDIQIADARVFTNATLPPSRTDSNAPSAVFFDWL